MEKDNEEVKAKLIEGKNRFSSAATVMQNVLDALDLIIVSLDLQWLGPASQAYTTAHNQFVTDVQTARDVLQKCANALQTMHDKIVEAEDIARKQEEADLITNIVILGVLFFADAVAAAVTPLLVAADDALASTLVEITSETRSIPAIDSEVTTVDDMADVETLFQPEDNPASTPDTVSNDSTVQTPNGSPSGNTVESPNKPTEGTTVTNPNDPPSGSTVADPNKPAEGTTVTDPNGSPSGSTLESPNEPAESDPVANPNQPAEDTTVAEPNKPTESTTGADPNEHPQGSTLESPNKPANTPDASSSDGDKLASPNDEVVNVDFLGEEEPPLYDEVNPPPFYKDDVSPPEYSPAADPLEIPGKSAESPVHELPKEIAPQEPITAFPVETRTPIKSETTSSPGEVRTVETYADGSTTTTTTYLPGQPEETTTIITRNPDGSIDSITTRNPDGSTSITRQTPQGPSHETTPPTRPPADDEAKSPEYQPSEPLQPSEGPSLPPEGDSPPSFRPDSPEAKSPEYQPGEPVKFSEGSSLPPEGDSPPSFRPDSPEYQPTEQGPISKRPREGTEEPTGEQLPSGEGSTSKPAKRPKTSTEQSEPPYYEPRNAPTGITDPLNPEGSFESFGPTIPDGVPPTPALTDYYMDTLNGYVRDGQILAGKAADSAIAGDAAGAAAFAEDAVNLTEDAASAYSNLITTAKGNIHAIEDAKKVFVSIERNAREAINAADTVGTAGRADIISRSAETIRSIPREERYDVIREAIDLSHAQEPGTQALPRDVAPGSRSPAPARNLPDPPRQPRQPTQPSTPTASGSGGTKRPPDGPPEGEPSSKQPKQ
jgi:uncharacterized protein YukE